MNQPNNNLSSKKSANKNSKNELTNSQRDIIKAKIMDKYGVSLKEADKILFEIEKIQNENRQNNVIHNGLKQSDVSNSEFSNQTAEWQKIGNFQRVLI